MRSYLKGYFLLPFDCDRTDPASDFDVLEIPYGRAELLEYIADPILTNNSRLQREIVEVKVLAI